MRHFLKKKNQNFQVLLSKEVLRFMSLIYGADFGRSRLVYSLLRCYIDKKLEWSSPNIQLVGVGI